MRSLNAGVLVLVGCLAGGCLDAGGKLCNNGLTCPDNLACDEAHDACVEPKQLTACNGLNRGDDCGIHSTDDGVCDQDICVVKRCGDGFRRGNEACDGDDVPPETSCKDLGFYDVGTPKCNDACSFDVDPATTVCTGYCGDGMLTPGIEVCEANSPLNSTCLDFGFGTGGLECADCRPDQRDCVPFGWQLTNLGASVINVHASAADDVWALLVDNFTNANTIAHFDGVKWSMVDMSGCPIVDPLSEYLFDIWSPAKGVLFAEGGELVVRVTPTTCTKLGKPPGLAGNFFTMWAPTANEVWAATVSNPTSQVWQHDGTNWNLKLSVPIANGTPWKIWGTGPTDVWMVHNGPASLSHYNGSTWQTGIDPGIADPRTIWGTATDVYVGNGSAVAIAHYSGGTWSAFPSPPATLGAILNGAATSDGKVYASGYGASLVVYDGVSWTDMGAPSGGAIWAGPGGDVWRATGDAGAVAHFAGSGRVAATSATNRGGLAMRTTTNAYSLTLVPGPAADLQLEHWDGATWQVDSNVPAPQDLAFSPTGKLMVVTSDNGMGDPKNGLYIRATNGTWTHPANVGDVWKVSVVADDNVWLLGFPDLTHSAFVFHWTSASSIDTFPIAKPPAGMDSPFFNDMWAFSNTNVYVVGSSQSTLGVNTPVILHSNGDPAAAWTSETLPTMNAIVRSIWAQSPTDLYAITDRGTLLHSTGNGTWVLVNTPPALKVRDVFGPPDDLFIATDNQVWRFDGVRWEPVSLGGPVAANQVMIVGSVIVALEGGTMHRIVRLAPW